MYSIHIFNYNNIYKPLVSGFFMIDRHARVIIELCILIGIVGMLLVALLLFGDHITGLSFLTGK